MPPTRRTTSTSENKPPRKRNVTSRGRTGCLTCRRRRLKCDETKPGCNNCRRINVQCEGYAQKITFKDQTNLTVERAKGNPTASRKKSQSSSVEAIGDDASKTSSTDGNQQSTPDQFIDYMVDLESSNSLDITRYGSIDANLEEVQGQITPPTTYHDIVSPVMATSKKTGYMTPRSPVSLDLCPSPPRVLPNASLGLAGAFEFPEDYTYFEYSAGGGLSSISRVLPLAELFQSESVSSHVYNAALALSALSLSTNNPVSHSTGTGSISLRRHAFHHSLKAIQGLQHELAQTQKLGSSSSNSSLRADSALSLFATIMLAANFELQRGSIPSWRSHMRGAASCLNATYAELTKKATGMLLIRAFARMALLLRLYNESYSVTTAEYMQPQLVNWLNRLLRESSRLHDRILLLVEEVTALEIQKRLHPELEDSTWSAKSADLLRRVEEWRNDLPPSDIPVDDNTSGTYLTISSQDMSTTNSSLLPIPPLHFPHSQDPCITAVNYASYLCIRMRALTRYSTSKTIHPQDTEQNALTICRIAAAHPPSHFGSSFTYSYGMLPSVVGAYRWSSNPGLRAWAKHWLTGYRTTREGIWDVTHTLRLIKLMDERVHPAERGRGEVFVAARTVDEPDEPEDELGIAEGGSGRKPFKIVLRTRGMGGSSSSVVMVN